ncbi:MAG: hypothetical protein EAZ51_07145 [Sphingobacteriales bacterium]|nr:MAG: hypothetical protein EAZ64_06350 [Sphingobacteriales bacterium]TAF79812.1 MAG: hypothetical protein EAZ51_07145 [Sphingobacteriales bacterium]
MKPKILLLLILTFISLNTFSQSNFRRWSVGIHPGVTIDNMDFRYDKPVGYNYEATKDFQTNKQLIFGVTTDFYITPYISVGLDLNKVYLKNGPDNYHRMYRSDFYSAEFKGGLVMGQFFRYDVDNWLLLFKNFYVASGVGILWGNNDVKPFNPNITGYPIAGVSPGTIIGNPLGHRQHDKDDGQSKFTGITVPLEVGYNVNFFDDYDEIRHVVSIGYRTNFTTTDNINGYADRANVGFRNIYRDTYSSVNLTYKYHFGAFGTYYKPIRSFF